MKLFNNNKHLTIQELQMSDSNSLLLDWTNNSTEKSHIAIFTEVESLNHHVSEMCKSHMTCHYNNQKQWHLTFTTPIPKTKGDQASNHQGEETYHIRMLQSERTLKAIHTTWRMKSKKPKKEYLCCHQTW